MMTYYNPKPGSHKTISGMFNSEDRIEALLSELNRHGIDSESMNVLMSDKTRAHHGSLKRESKGPEGATIGGISGGLLGGLLGGLTMVGTLLIPGVNLLVAGPMVGAIAGGALGTATGGLIGALVGLGIPEYEAKVYEKDLKTEGNVLIIAHVLKEEVPQVRDIFKTHSAKNVIVQKDPDEIRQRS